LGEKEARGETRGEKKGSGGKRWIQENHRKLREDDKNGRAKQRDLRHWMRGVRRDAGLVALNMHNKQQTSYIAILPF
jgi:hypothetical protein